MVIIGILVMFEHAKYTITPIFSDGVFENSNGLEKPKALKFNLYKYSIWKPHIILIFFFHFRVGIIIIRQATQFYNRNCFEFQICILKWKYLL